MKKDVDVNHIKFLPLQNVMDLFIYIKKFGGGERDFDCLTPTKGIIV